MPVGDDACEGRVLPVALGARLDGHDVQVRHEDARRKAEILPRPMQQQTRPFAPLRAQVDVDRRKLSLKPVEQRSEGRAIKDGSVTA